MHKTDKWGGGHENHKKRTLDFRDFADKPEMGSLQYKAWALVVAVVGALTSVVVWFSSQSIAASYAVLEQTRALQDGARAHLLLQQQLQNLSASGKDYAYWTDAVEFVTGENPTHLEDNFTLEGMASLRMSGVVYFDTQGRVAGSTALTEAGELAAVSPDVLAVAARLMPPVLADSRSETLIDTYHQIAGTLYLMSAAPIRAPNAEGSPPQGAQVVFRRFGNFETERFSQVILNPLSVSFEPVPAGSEDLSMITRDEHRAEARAVVRDHQNAPVAQLVVSLDRQLHEQGRSLVVASALQVALASLLLGALLVFLLDRLVLQRLLRLHADLKHVASEGPSAGSKVRVDGRDELSQVSRGINVLLDRVRSDAITQREDQEKNALQQLEIQRMKMQKTEALGRLTAGIAHDFNNALAAISGWVRLASEDLENPHPSHEALQQAMKATTYANGLMRQLLAFGRQSTPSLRRLRLAPLIDECRQLVAAGLAKDCEVSLDCRVEHDEVDADPTQLQQVLVNLLINAADAMKGKGRIDLILDDLVLPMGKGMAEAPGTLGLADGHYLVLKVRDHGPGIPADLQPRIFDPFFTTKPRGKGTGLGLSVAQGVVARHYGAIGLTSDSDGACFHVYLPVSKLSAEAIQGVSTDGPTRGGQLLFVDDDPSVRHALSALLERKGWLVTRACDGEAGWAQYSQSGQHFDVVLTDQSMPKLDGVGLAKRIRATASSTPIVLMSGHVAEVEVELLESLFNAVLHKPVDDVELDRVLKSCLSGTGGER